MATTAMVAPGTDALEREAKALEAEIAGLRDKVTAEQSTIARLRGEQEKLIEAIGLKKEKPAKAVELAAEIAGSESVITGLTRLIAPKENRLSEVITELRHQRDARQRAEAVEEIAKLERDAEIIITRIASALDSTVRPDLEKYFAVFHRLDRLVGQVQFGVFPIPAPALRASEARQHLSKLVLEKFSPIMEMFGR